MEAGLLIPTPPTGAKGTKLLGPGESRGFSILSDQQLKGLSNYFVLPNMTLNLTGSGCVVRQWIPRVTNPLKCQYGVQALCLALSGPSNLLFEITQAADDQFVLMGPNLRPDCYDLNQDIERLWRRLGPMSRSFGAMLFSNQESRIPHYPAKIDRYLSGAKG
jgi:hypothetical protein